MSEDMQKILREEIVGHGMVCVTVASSFLGIPMRLIREIIKKPQLTQVYRAPTYVCGLLNLRGQVITAIDIAQRIGLKKEQQDMHRYLLVMKTNDEIDAQMQQNFKAGEHKVGFLVHAITDVLHPQAQQVQPVPANIDPQLRCFVTATCRHGEQTLSVVSPFDIVRENQTSSVWMEREDIQNADA